MSVFYTNVARDGADLLVRIADHNGNRKLSRVKKFQPTLYLPTHDYNNVDKIGLKDQPLVARQFNSIREADNYIEEYKDVHGSEVYGQTNWAYQFIAHKFPGEITPDFSNIHIANVDIEVFSAGWDVEKGELLKGPFPEPVIDESSKIYRGGPRSMGRYLQKVKASQEFVRHHFPNSFIDVAIDSFDAGDPEDPESCDITVDPESLNAAFPIPLIQLQDMANNKYHIFGMPAVKDRMKFNYNPEDTEIGGLEVVYHEFEREQDLLLAFLEHWQLRQYDGWTGWNIETFDSPYLVERIRIVLGDAAVNRLSPWGIVKKRMIKSPKGDVTTYDFVGCETLDYMQIYKKHTYTTREKYSLDWIAYCELKERKLDYSESKSLNTLYFEDYDKYVRYGIKDTKLVYRLEVKLRLLQLMFVLAYKTKSNYRDGLGTVSPWLALCYWKLYESGIVPQIKRVYQGPTDFEGAYVMEVIPGRYRWVISKDLNSLYPHIIQQYNLGPETIVDDTHKRREIIESMVAELNAKIRDMTTPVGMRPKYKALADKLLVAIDERIQVVDQLIDIGLDFQFETLKKYNVSFTANVQFFSNEKMSFLSGIMRGIYSGRKVEKAEGLRYEQYSGWCKEMSHDSFNAESAKKSRFWDEQWFNETIIIPKEKLKFVASEWEDKATVQDVLQQGLKILMNAGYGAISNVWFKEYFDLRIAEAITTCGQLINKWNKRQTDIYLNKEFGTAGLDYVIAGDTDSNYVCLERLVNKNWPEETDIHKITDNIDEWVKTAYAPKVNEWCEGLCGLMNGFEQRMIWEREVIAPEAIWRAKKMYCMAVLDSEGVRYEKPKIKFKGLEARKSSTPEWCREKLALCYETILLGTEEQVQKQIQEFRTEYMKLDVGDIAKASSVSDIEKWMDRGTYIKGTHFAAKASITYNKLVDKYPDMGLTPIESGDKVAIVMLKKNNPLGEDYLAFPDYLDPELDLHKWVDYNQAFDKGFISPVQTILDTIGWNWKHRVNLMALMMKQGK